MREFNLFVDTLFKVQLSAFLAGFSFLVLLKGFSLFTLSFVVGYVAVAVNYLFLVRFSRKVPELVSSGVVPNSGFGGRFFFTLLVLLFFALFTPVNFFAIILAVALSQVGLFVAVLIQGKERKGWKEQL